MINNYFLKCDISGIQSFIFNVPSNGAARALKNRSVFVKNIAGDCLDELKKFFGNENAKVIYNGGGNFHIKVSTDKSEEDINNFIEKFQSPYLKQDIFPFIAFVEKKSENISDSLDAVNKKVQKAKMQRPICLDLLDAKPITVEEVDINSIKDINGQVPNGVFSDIADKSTGDKKLAALKLDVDNLGSLFRNRTEEDYNKLSKALTNFFDRELLQLIKDLKMQQNIYVVFSGGDDCFLIGTWEKIFELAITLQQKFYDFQCTLKKEIASLPNSEITFSAGIIVTDEKHPMIRLAEEVEDALSASKRAVNKNSITCFGKTIQWRDFERSKKISDQLFKLIENNGESKSLINRIKSSDIGFDKLQQNAYNGKIDIPKVWRLKYYLERNISKENNKEVEELFNEYTKTILDAFMKKQTSNPNLYPIAARWAELLLKKNL